ncbi:MAG: hypothetical protein ACI8PB_003423 [Desulforhopalus sp.]|jgi:hypothetical protein
MKKILCVVVIGLMVSGCAGMMESTNKTSIEAEDIGPITNRTVKAMNDCIDYKLKKQCEEADRLLEKHEWLLSRDVRITNMDGMRQNEWDIEVRTTNKNLDIISQKIGKFFSVNY